MTTAMRGWVDVDAVVGLDPPAIVAAHEDLHQLRPDDPVGRDGDPLRHRGHAVYLTVDVDDRHVWRDEANAMDQVMLCGTSVERRQDLGVSLSEG